jgi:hypothetical protein
MKIAEAVLLTLLSCFAFGSQATAAPVAQAYVLTGRGMNETLRAADLSPYTDVILSFAHPDANGQMVDGDSLSCMPAPNRTMATTADLQAAVDFIHAGGGAPWFHLAAP